MVLESISSNFVLSLVAKPSSRQFIIGLPLIKFQMLDNMYLLPCVCILRPNLKSHLEHSFNTMNYALFMFSIRKVSHWAVQSYSIKWGAFHQLQLLWYFLLWNRQVQCAVLMLDQSLSILTGSSIMLMQWFKVQQAFAFELNISMIVYTFPCRRITGGYWQSSWSGGECWAGS